nr:MAG TPA_asm: hypothetical protein [Caudoviricetes sp.]
MQFPRDRTSWLARKQGDWQPGMPTFISFVILGLFTTQGANRGVDYITGDRPDVTQSLTVVEQAMPLHYWGVLFLIASTVVAAGMLFRRAQVIITGCLCFVVLYSGITWGLTVKMLTRMTPVEDFWHVLTAPESHAPSGLAWALIGALCVLCAILCGLVNKHTEVVILASTVIIVLAFVFATGGHLGHFIGEVNSFFPLDGWRTPSSFAMTTIIWGLFAWGTKVMQKARRA